MKTEKSITQRAEFKKNNKIDRSSRKIKIKREKVYIPTYERNSVITGLTSIKTLREYYKQFLTNGKEIDQFFIYFSVLLSDTC